MPTHRPAPSDDSEKIPIGCDSRTEIAALKDEVKRLKDRLVFLEKYLEDVKSELAALQKERETGSEMRGRGRGKERGDEGMMEDGRFYGGE